MKTLLITGGFLCAIGVSLGAPALASFAGERTAWRLASQGLEGGEYDAVLSDSLYRRSEETRKDAEWAAIALVLGALLMLAGWTPKSAGLVPERAWRATLVDGALAWNMFAFAFYGDALGLWDTQENALAAGLAAAAPAFLLLPYAPLAAGRSIGLWLFGGGLPISRRFRLRAALLGPFSLPLLLLPFWVFGRFSRLKAAHLLPLSFTNTTLPRTPEKQA